MASGGTAAVILLAVAISGPALGQAVKPVWSDNEDGRANLFLGPQPDYAKTSASSTRQARRPRR